MTSYKFGFVSGILAIAFMFGGCSYIKSSMAKSKYIHETTKAYVYKKPLKQVWPKARQILFKKGYSVNDSGEYMAETEWKTNDTNRERYLLAGIEVDDESCKIQFTHASESRDSTSGSFSGGVSTERDLDLEYKLIKNVSQKEHDRIEKEAEAKGQEASKK